jgi:hypothetical protein
MWSVKLPNKQTEESLPLKSSFSRSLYNRTSPRICKIVNEVGTFADFDAKILTHIMGLEP